MIWPKNSFPRGCVYPCRAEKVRRGENCDETCAGGRYKSELDWPLVTITRGWPGWPLTTQSAHHRRHKHGAAPRPRSHGQEGAGEPPGGALWQILQGIRRSFRYSARSQGNGDICYECLPSSWCLQKHDLLIHDLEMEVNDMNGKFVIPKLKKVKHLHVAETEDWSLFLF